MSPFLILFAIFAFVTLLVQGVFFLLFGRSVRRDPRLRARLDNLMGAIDKPTQASPEKGSVLREEFVQKSPILSLMRLGFPSLSDLGLRLQQAGMGMSPGRFAQLWVLLIILGSLFGSFYPSGRAGLFLGAAFGGIVPHLVLKLKKRRREKAFEKQFPESLRLLATSLKAGHALPASIRMLGEELPPPVSEEFQKVSEESRLGLSIEDALKNMLKRVDSPDIRFFVTSIMIQRETGGNLAAILQQLDGLIRERFRIRGQIKALTAPGRATGALLSIMPVGMGGILTLLNPSYMAPLWETSAGQLFAIGGFVLQGMGYLAIRRIVNVRI